MTTEYEIALAEGAENRDTGFSYFDDRRHLLLHLLEEADPVVLKAAMDFCAMLAARPAEPLMVWTAGCPAASPPESLR